MPVAANKGQYLTLQEAAERFGVAVRTVRSWRAKRLVTRYVRGDGLAVVDADEVERMLASRRDIIRNLDDDESGENDQADG